MWLLGLGIGSSKSAGGRKLLLVAALLCTAVPLLCVKEIDFVSDLFLHTGRLSWWVVPAGFAFWSLQLISYAVDVCRGKIRPQRNPLKFLLFVSFFPQIIQGPIPRYDQLAGQLCEGHRFDERRFVKGFMLILWGFFLKLCIADKAAVIVNAVFDTYPTYQGAYVYLAGVLYSFQLYADFMSCTTLAQGISELFGITLVDNFHHPYFSTSIADFWRRWHISLSSWLRDYIYIPLGGNRKGKVRKYINVLITFVVSGIWHGGGFKFLFWGLLHGFYQVTGGLLSPLRKRLERLLSLDRYPGFTRVLRAIITFHLVMLAWIIFRADHLRTGLSMIASIVRVPNIWIFTNDAIFGLGLGWKECAVLVLCLLILLGVSLVQERGILLRDRILGYNLPARWAVYIGVILFVLLFGTYGYGFDAQAFIYGGF